MQPHFAVDSVDNPDWLPSISHPHTVVGVYVDVHQGVSVIGFSCTLKSGGKTIRFTAKEDGAPYTLGSVLSGEAVSGRVFQTCLIRQWNGYCISFPNCIAPSVLAKPTLAGSTCSKVSAVSSGNPYKIPSSLASNNQITLTLLEFRLQSFL